MKALFCNESPVMNILLTHSEGRLEDLAQALRTHGFRVTHQPLVHTELLPAREAYREVERLRGADWLLFSSRTAVQAWAALGLSLDTYNIGVVGQKTAAEVERVGGTVSLRATPENAEGLLETFLTHVSPPLRVGLPCGEGALPTLSNLADAGFTVTKAVLYRTVTRPLTRLDADLIVLASPSAVAALPPTLGRTRLVALGPSTHEAVRKRGWHAAEAQTPDAHGVVQAVLRATLETHQEFYAAR